MMAPSVSLQAQSATTGVVFHQTSSDPPRMEIHHMNLGTAATIQSYFLERAPSQQSDAHANSLRIIGHGDSNSQRSCVFAKEILTEGSKLAPESRAQIEKTLAEIESAGLFALPAPSYGWTDGGSLMIEWALDDRRVGFIFSDETTDNGWFYVDRRDGRITSQSGQIGARNAAAILSEALN